MTGRARKEGENVETKLYFYGVDSDGKITCNEAVARKNAKGYLAPETCAFPGYRSRVDKDAIGHVSDGYVTLTRKGEKTARRIWKAWYEDKLRRELERVEACRKILAAL